MQPLSNHARQGLLRPRETLTTGVKLSRRLPRPGVGRTRTAIDGVWAPADPPLVVCCPVETGAIVSESTGEVHPLHVAFTPRTRSIAHTPFNSRPVGSLK
jgi:hypothetical protein